MKVQVMSINGQVAGEVELPPVFEEEYRPDLIRRAVLALQSVRYQPHGVDPYAGLRTSAHSWGSGRGVAHVPRIKNGSRAARVPQAKGGREAHPPKVAKVLIEKINVKEMRKAVRSAIAATAIKELAIRRGHLFGCQLPLVVEDRFEELKKTAEVTAALKNLGVYEDIEHSRRSKNLRAGRGKMRGRTYKQKKSVLIVTAKAPLRAAMNLPGVDVAMVRQLNAELLAPGTHPGRLTLWTEGAIRELGGGIE